ncbi:MAG TPA: hypothetical protein VH681_11280 [Nitrospiraceae bacterium]
MDKKDLQPDYHNEYDDGDAIGDVMTGQELNRAIQYVTASTSHSRDIIGEILRTGLGELSSLALESQRQFERESLLEYVSQWTMKRTAYPEPLVREILACAGRWLDQEYDEMTKHRLESLGESDEGTASV